MEIDRAIANVAATGQRNGRSSTSSEQWTEHANTGAHSANEFVIGDNGRAVDHFQPQRVVSLAFADDAERAEKLRQRSHVNKIGNVVQSDWPVGH